MIRSWRATLLFPKLGSEWVGVFRMAMEKVMMNETDEKKVGDHETSL